MTHIGAVLLEMVDDILKTCEGSDDKISLNAWSSSSEPWNKCETRLTETHSIVSARFAFMPRKSLDDDDE